MTVLSDRDIARSVAYNDSGIEIDPYDESNLQPASYDVTLGDEFVAYEASYRSVVDGCRRFGDGLPDADAVEFHGNTPISPIWSRDELFYKFVLGHTEEYISLPPNATAEFRGRSSIGRMGLIPHTAGWIDPGFEGQIVLEFVNFGPYPIELEPGTRIGQLIFSNTESSASVPYGEKSDQKYQGQSGATESRIQDDRSNTHG